jgi:hypothetical protein
MSKEETSPREVKGEFRALLRTAVAASDGGATVRRRFPELLHERGFSILLPHAFKNRSGSWLALGTATWSGYDLELLDRLAPFVGHMSIWVFDVADVPSKDHFVNFVPNLSRVFQTPVVGHWVNGELMFSGWGFEAREYVLTLLAEFGTP